MSDSEIYRNANTYYVSGAGSITGYVGGVASISIDGTVCAFAVVSSIPCREVFIQAHPASKGDIITVSLTSAVTSVKGLVVPVPTASVLVSAAGIQSPTLQLPINNVGHLWFYSVKPEVINVMWRN